MTHDCRYLARRLETVTREGGLLHVNIHPASDMWMRGGTRGIITAVGRKWVSVRVYSAGKPVRHTPYKFSPNLLELA